MSMARVVSRREFLNRSTAVAVATSTLGVARGAHAAGSDVVKLALIGAGGRGNGAVANALNANAGFRLWAVADAFPERLQRSLKALGTRFKDRAAVPPERQFFGLDGGLKAIQSGADMVLLCEPPGFRPAHFEAAVKAGKQIFMEKPVAVDGPGYRRVLAANVEAKNKGLVVGVGHHLRHEVKHREVIKRIRDGALGEIKYLRAYFNTGDLWTRPRQPEDTELMYQVRNWYHFTWLSGDHIVEQHVHDLDVANWMMGDAHPLRANGMGGRQVRIGTKYGEIYDHHAVEFEYADGVRLFSFCRQIPGCWGSFSEHAHGTKGEVNIEGHGRAVIRVDGAEPVRLERGPDGHQLEWDDLVAAMQGAKAYNELDTVAAATMTAILGRMATYSGKIVEWDQAVNSQLALGPENISRPGPDGIYPCAIPGATKAF